MHTNVRITRVETVPLRIPFKGPYKIGSGAARAHSEILLVRLHTNEGLVGTGETQAWRRQGASETLESLTAAIRDHFSPHIVGQSPFSIASIMPKLEAAVYHSLYAQAAVGDALYDLQGKVLGMPVHQLLGGKCRDSVGACAVLTMKPKLDETIAGAAAYYERGYRSFNLKVGADPKGDVQNVRAIREQFPDAVINVDANAGMTFDSALALLKKLERFDLDAAEQLLPLWDVDGMAELARRVDVAIIADECVSTDHDLISVIRKRAASGVQTKVGKCGGIWYSRKLWQIADAAGFRIYPGNHPGTSIASASVAHVAAAWPGDLPDGPFAVGLDNLADDIAAEPLQREGNLIRVPDGPGLGVKLDEEKIRKLRVDL